MPRRGTLCGAKLARSVPLNSILPPLRGASPMIARSVVVLPTPLRPSKAADSPGLISKVTPWRMWSFPIWTWTSCSLSMDSLIHVALVLGTAQIRFAHLFVVSDFLRAAAGEQGALCQHGDIVGDAEHDFHIVLDDDDADVAREFADLRHRALGPR